MMATRAFLMVCLLLTPAGVGLAAGSELETTEPGLTEAEAPATTVERVQAEGAASESPMQAVEAAPPGNVLRAILTTEIREREPVDSVETLSNDVQQIFFFTEIENAAEQTLTHRWEHAGRVVAEVPLTIGANRWRTYSSKLLDPAWLGDWTVSVVDESGRVLSSASFSYSVAPADAAEPPAALEEIPPASPSME